MGSLPYLQWNHCVGKSLSPQGFAMDRLLCHFHDALDHSGRPYSATSSELVHAQVPATIVFVPASPCSRFQSCTGIRIVRAWSAIERVIAWRIHQVYVENLYPLAVFKFFESLSWAPFPSWIRSRKESPWFVYFSATEMTRRGSLRPFQSCSARRTFSSNLWTEPVRRFHAFCAGFL